LAQVGNVLTSWTKTAGYTSTYQTGTTIPSTVNQTTVSISENGTPLTAETSIALVDSTAASYYTTAATGAITIYIHATGGGNPATNGNTYTLVVGTLPNPGQIADWPGTWQTFSPSHFAAAGAALWGGITGTLSNQTDLATALSGKQGTITTGTVDQMLNGTLGLTSVANCVSAGGVLNYSTTTHLFSCHTLVSSDIPNNAANTTGSAALTVESFTVGTGGVTANTLVIGDSSSPQKMIAATGTGAYGVAQSTVVAGGTVLVTRLGQAQVLTDNAVTAGDLAIAGTSTVTYARDSGQTSSANIPITTRILGPFLTSASAGSLATIELTPAHFGTQITASQVTNAAATNASNTFTAGTQDFSGAAHTKPNVVVASVGALPSGCTNGEQATVTSAPPGQQLYTGSVSGGSCVWKQLIGGIASNGTYSLNCVAGTGGTIANGLVKWAADGTCGSVTGTEGILGIAETAQLAAAQVIVDIIGPSTCLSEGSITAGDFLIAGVTTPTSCKDSGQSSMANIPSTTRILGKATASVLTGNPVGVNLIAPFTPGDQLLALTGDVTAAAGSGATTVVKLNGTSLAGLASGLLTNTNGTGVPTITTLPLAQTNMTPVALVAGTGGALSSPQEFYVCTTTCSVTPPTPAVGLQFCVRNAPGVSTIITLTAISGVQYEKTDASAYGTAATAATSGGVIGDKICIVGLDTAHYLTYSYVGTWTVN